METATSQISMKPRKWREWKVSQKSGLVTYKICRSKGWVPNHAVPNKQTSKHKLSEQNTGTSYTISKPPRYSLIVYSLPNTQLNNHTLSVYTFSITTQYSTVTSFTEKQSQDQQNTCSSSSIIKCAMPWDAMSNIVMHVFLNDTHPLSLSPGPMGDISVHASVANHDMTLDNSNHRGAIHPSKYSIHRGAQYVPRNGTSS